MRSDMFKVIVERPRSGHKLRGETAQHERHLAKTEDPENLAHRISMSMRDKNLNENLSPLKKFLASCVGRRWDDVFSEICEHLNCKSTVHQHVRDHLKDYVELHVILVEGVPSVIGRYSSGVRPVYEGDLYVHPETGILARAPNNKKTRDEYRAEQKVAADAVWRKVDKYTAFAKLKIEHHHKEDGPKTGSFDLVWFRIGFDDLTPNLFTVHEVTKSHVFRSYSKKKPDETKIFTVQEHSFTGRDISLSTPGALNWFSSSSLSKDRYLYHYDPVARNLSSMLNWVSNARKDWSVYAKSSNNCGLTYEMARAACIKNFGAPVYPAAVKQACHRDIKKYRLNEPA